MANTNEQFDQHFREKLEGHREKPSALAWERLNNQLPKKSKPALGIWWAVAATVTAVLMAGYSFWPADESAAIKNQVAEKTETSFQDPIETSVASPAEVQQNAVTEINAPETKIQTETVENQPQNTPKASKKTKPTAAPALSQASQNLVAQNETKSKEPILVQVPELKTEELIVALPELKAPELEKTIANTSSDAEEPLYRVNIYSNGVKKGEAPDKNLINELGKTVGQVEGFLGQLDDQLIGLQEKKDNLFSSLTTKKNEADERR